MIIGVLTRRASGWASSQLIRAIQELGHRPFPFSFGDVLISIDGGGVSVRARDVDVSRGVQAVIVRPIGRSTLEEAIFRLDVLYTLRDCGVAVVNEPEAIERAVDKYRAIHVLRQRGIPVPKTIVSENPNIAFRSLDELGENVVIKPIFGSRGLGSTMLNDRDTIWRVVQHLAYIRSVIYLQRYLEHGHRDIRAFVVGGRVVAAMVRENPRSWKTNIARGARPRPITLTGELEELAIRAAEALGCEYAGVDILISGEQPYVLEVNSQPTWRGLQSVTKVDIAKEIVSYVVSKARR